MEDWDYYISGIWALKTDGKNGITDVFLHAAAGGFGKGVKTSKDTVVKLLKKGARITTITWNYHLIQWRFGAKIEYEEVDGENYLHTVKGAATFDELDSAMQMQYILTDLPAAVFHN